MITMAGWSNHTRRQSLSNAYIVLTLSMTGRQNIRFFFFFQAEDGIRDLTVTGVQTCALPIFRRSCADGIVGGVRVRPEPSPAVLGRVHPRLSKTAAVFDRYRHRRDPSRLQRQDRKSVV